MVQSDKAMSKTVNEYDQELPHSQAYGTAGKGRT